MAPYSITLEPTFEMHVITVNVCFILPHNRHFNKLVPFVMHVSFSFYTDRSSHHLREKNRIVDFPERQLLELLQITEQKKKIKEPKPPMDFRKG